MIVSIQPIDSNGYIDNRNVVYFHFLMQFFIETLWEISIINGEGLFLDHKVDIRPNSCTE